MCKHAAYRFCRRTTCGFPLLNLLSGFDQLPVARRRMLEVEAAQLAVSSERLTGLLPDLDTPPEQLSMDDRRRIAEALREHRSASGTFRRFIGEARL